MIRKLLSRRPVCLPLIFAAVFAGYGVALLLGGGTHEIYLNYNPAYTCEKVDVFFGENGERTQSAIVAVKDIQIRSGYVRVVLKALEKGKEHVVLREYSALNGKNIEKNGTTEDITVGALHIVVSSVYEHIYLVLSVLSLLLLLYYGYCFGSAVKTRRFSYETVFFLCVALFFAVLLAVWGSASVYSFTQYHTTASEIVYSVNRNLITMLTIATLPFMLVFALSVSVSNIVLMKKEGFRPTNALGIITSAVMTGGLAVIAVLFYIDNGWDIPAVSVAYAVLSALYVFFVIVLISAVIYGIYSSRYTPPLNKDYIIILGCMIRPDGTLYPLLRGRVDAAIDFYHKQLQATGKAAVFIPSGGQGADEIIPEARAMKNYLMERGIPEEQIIPEERSTTTRENMRFSKEIIDAQKKNAETAFATTSYHVLRSGAIAYANGMNIDGIGSRTKWYFWPNAFLREVAGIFVSQPKKQVVIILLIALCAAFGSYIYSLL